MSRKNSVIIVHDSMVKRLTEPRVSNKNHVKIKVNPCVTTEIICDYIKLSSRKNPDFFRLYLATNNVTTGINTMIKIQKVEAIVEEMDKYNRIKLGFSPFIDRDKVSETDGIVAVNERLENYCLVKIYSLLLITILLHLA